ncbi:MAG: M23 family metallopeptidase [Usitatibacter sp.]
MTQSSVTSPDSISSNQTAGLVLAISTLLVVTALAVAQTFREPLVPTVLAMASEEDIRERAASLEPGGKLAFPVLGLDPAKLRDNFDEGRGKRRHEALDIMAPRGTPVVAVDDGRVARVTRSILGGLSVYQYDVLQNRVYFYAHLDGYAKGLEEGMFLKRGAVLGYVGSTGNAPKHAPHLHFTIFELGADKRWWKGRAANPYPLLKPE